MNLLRHKSPTCWVKRRHSVEWNIDLNAWHTESAPGGQICVSVPAPLLEEALGCRQCSRKAPWRLVKKMSSVLTFNMCLACVCARRLCRFIVVWYLPMRTFASNVGLSRRGKKHDQMWCACEETRWWRESMENMLPITKFFTLVFSVSHQRVGKTDYCHVRRIEIHKSIEAGGVLEIKSSRNRPENFPA